MPDAYHKAVDTEGTGLSGFARRRRFDSSLLRRRSIALILTILVHALLLLLVLLTRAPTVPRKEDDRLVTFSVMPDPAKKDAGDRSKAREQKDEKSSAAPPAPKPALTPPPPAVLQPKPETPPSFIQLSPQDFAAADLGKMASKGSTAGGGSNGNSGAVAGPGQGPGGVQLYEAEWYRRPTDAELAGYMPANPPTEGWGLVACKTIEQYHVENCQTLGESPIGSGFAKAVRLAAWQFLVRPPRIDGKPQVGAWVRIRIDYTRHVVVSDQP